MEPIPSPSRALTWLGASFAAVFALSAFVQLNDPDWLPWFAFYVAGAVACIATPRLRRGWVLAAALAAVALAWAGVIGSGGLEPITWAELTGDLRMKTVNVERHREIGGLGLAAAMLGVLAAGRLAHARGGTSIRSGGP